MWISNAAVNYPVSTYQAVETDQTIHTTENMRMSGWVYDPKSNTLSCQEARVNSMFSNITVTFDNLYAKWKQETSFVSSTKIFKDINYQKIVALGVSVLQTLIQKLNGSSTFLFPALHQVTGIDPIQPEHVGNTALMTEDWKHWWDENRQHYA